MLVHRGLVEVSSGLPTALTLFAYCMTLLGKHGQVLLHAGVGGMPYKSRISSAVAIRAGSFYS